MARYICTLSHNSFFSPLSTLYWDMPNGGWYKTATGGSPVSRVPVPKLRGYKFLGYYTHNNTYAQSVRVIDDAGAILSGAWRNNSSYRTVFAQGKNVTNFKTVNYCNGKGAGEIAVWVNGKNVASAPTPTWRGHRFLGYYNAETGGTQYVSPDGGLLVGLGSLPATLYAQWEDAPTFAAEDFFNLASDALIPISSTSGAYVERAAAAHYGRYSSGVNASGGTLLAPSVTYAVVKDTTVNAYLGRAFAALYSSGSMTVSGYMITAIRVETAIGSFPRVTVSAVANEGAPAINEYQVSIPVVARSKAQNLLGAISGGGFLQRLAITATCDPVVLMENLMPCASDIVNGRYELDAETIAANGESAPTMAEASGANGGFALIESPEGRVDCDFLRYAVKARKELT